MIGAHRGARDCSHDPGSRGSHLCRKQNENAVSGGLSMLSGSLQNIPGLVPRWRHSLGMGSHAGTEGRAARRGHSGQLLRGPVMAGHLLVPRPACRGPGLASPPFRDTAPLSNSHVSPPPPTMTSKAWVRDLGASPSPQRHMWQ